ncbi:hypothetical protein J6590_015520 [Homalodisca vitripennis]|nr:hypothetical protein J6590_015520 [Homalodisca vitripennis]
MSLEKRQLHSSLADMTGILSQDRKVVKSRRRGNDSHNQLFGRGCKESVPRTTTPPAGAAAKRGVAQPLHIDRSRMCPQPSRAARRVILVGCTSECRSLPTRVTQVAMRSPGARRGFAGSLLGPPAGVQHRP